jgi:DNA polymerase I-like protein with 3'-5' exonuclease and polymerase domains
MIVATISHGRKVLKSFLNYPWFAIDSETKPKKKWSEPPYAAKATLVHPRMEVNIFSLCHKGESYSFPTATFDLTSTYPMMSEWMEIFNEFLVEAKKRNIVAVMHNANYDVRVFDDAGLHLRQLVIWDTAIGAWMSDSNAEKSLKARMPRYGRHLVNTKTVDFSELKQLSYYAEQDAVGTDEMYQMQRFHKLVRPNPVRFIGPFGMVKWPNSIPEKKLVKIPGETLTSFERQFLRFQEFPVLRATIRAEDIGVPVDWKKMEIIRNTIQSKQTELEKQIFRRAGTVFNLNSRPQLSSVMQKLGVKSGVKTKKGAESWSAEALFYLKGADPIIESIIDHRKNDKLLSTYVGEDGLELYRNPKTNRIHCNLNTTGAVTGRFSSSQPNLQNIPARADTFGIRSCFIAPKGKLLICLDFSQIELRIMALLSRDPKMMTVLRDPKGDIHQTTADGFHVVRDPIAKQCNFLLIFGGQAYMLAKNLTLAGVPTEEEEAARYVAGFNSLYVRVPEYRLEMMAFHRKFGYVPLLTGRTRVIENVDSNNRYLLHKAETQMANNLVQGSAQDVMKASIVRADPKCLNPDAAVARSSVQMEKLHKALLNDYARRLEKFRREFRLAQLQWHLQVHDENVFSADKSAAYDMGCRLNELMGWKPYWPTIVDMDVPIRADGGIGENWQLAKKPKDKKFVIHSQPQPF